MEREGIRSNKDGIISTIQIHENMFYFMCNRGITRFSYKQHRLNSVNVEKF